MSTNSSKDTIGNQGDIPAVSSSRHPECWGMVLCHCFPPGNLEEVKEKSVITTLMSNTTNALLCSIVTNFFTLMMAPLLIKAATAAHPGAT